MPSVRGFLFTLLILAAVYTGLLVIPSPKIVAAESTSGCITCHTDRDALTRNLSAEKPKKSALTSGAG